MHKALMHQAAQCGSLGSPVYERLLTGLAVDFSQRGVTTRLLGDTGPRPIHDAVPLRLLGALHRLALTGDAPVLAAHFPSCGGSPGPTLVDDALSVLAEHSQYVSLALSEQVQTNEVGRSLVPLVLGRWLPTIGVGEYLHLELGSSAGLNLNFDLYCADDGRATMGTPTSQVRFGPDWFESPPGLPAHSAAVIAQHGVDPHPVDPTTDAGRTRLLSFVWPDQTDRFTRLNSALDIARERPPRIEHGSADSWLVERLDSPPAVATVVFHSIVWQYVGPDVQAGVRSALERAGSEARPDAPLAWVRMEPAGPVADVRATVWAGGPPREQVLAEIGYHGRGLRWFGD